MHEDEEDERDDDDGDDEKENKLGLPISLQPSLSLLCGNKSFYIKIYFHKVRKLQCAFPSSLLPSSYSPHQCNHFDFFSRS